MRGTLFLIGLLAGASAFAKGEAKLKIEGLGPLGNWESRVSLERLLGDERGPVLSANAVEDAMFLLMSAVQEDGFLKPVIEVELTAENGERSKLVLDAGMNVAVPRDTAARAVKFHVQRGVRYHIADVRFEGLSLVPLKTAQGFFIGESTLLTGKAARAYTPGRLGRGLDSLGAELRQRGYAEAAVRARDVAIDDQTGEVRLAIEVREGVPWRVADVRIEHLEPTDVVTASVERFVGQPWTDVVPQDIGAEIRRIFFTHGHPDVRVRVIHEAGALVDGRKDVKVTVRVRAGAQVMVGQVRYEGGGDVKENVLRRRVRAVSGQPLNVLEFEQARYRISRLGVFNRVELGYEPATGPVRDPVFTLHPGRRMEVNLLGGYGTYEQLRAGVEVRQYNLFGLAHQARGLLVESMKSTRGEYTYTVPEIFGESIDGTAKLFFLQREEVAFERQEYGGTFVFSAPINRLGVNATAGYTFEALRNRNNELTTEPIDETQVIVASVNLGLVRDRRDNPLTPRKGYRLFAQLEGASRKFGGEAEYQRFEVGGAYHTPWGNGRWVHASVSHGVITTLGETDESLPVNKRFFPGGDGSNRGYPVGEAAPRGPDGKFAGAKSYVGATLEFEQALARKFTGVIFSDAIGSSMTLREYPFEDVLVAAGVGLRYQTLIGPIRLEYGRNLNPRPADPGGTWLLSIGFPF